MSLSPNKGQIPLLSSKLTPYRGAGITKTLLTPCRRLGLSRKFKTNNQSSPNTPIATPVVSSAINTPSPVIKVKEDPIVIPSPKQSEKKLPKRNVSGSTRVNIQSRFKNEPVGKDLSGDSLTDDNKPKKVSNSNKSKGNDKKLKRTNREHKENKPINSVLCDNSNEENISKQLCEKTKPSPQKIKPKPSNIDSTLNGAPKNKFKRCLSLKKSSSSVDELTDGDSLSNPKTSSSSLLSNEFLKECSVNEDKMMKISQESDEQINIAPRKKRCIVLSSDDEDDFVSSQNSVKKSSQNELKDEDWVAKVVEIKNQIKKKEAHLANLKQAEVYRRLHNVKELGESIKMWKKCCEEGLVNLLPKLQEHGEMDMPALLRNLNIPKTIVYDPNTVGFI